MDSQANVHKFLTVHVCDLGVHDPCPNEIFLLFREFFSWKKNFISNSIFKVVFNTKKRRQAWNAAVRD
jgi:hypothetical protein